MMTPNTVSTWFSHELCLGRYTNRTWWCSSLRNSRRVDCDFKIPALPFFSQHPLRIASLRHPFHQTRRPVDVESIDNEGPFRIRITGDGLFDVADKIRLGACRTNCRGDHFPCDHMEVADERGRAVADVFELVTGDLIGAQIFVGSDPLQCLNAGHLVTAHGMRARLLVTF